MPDSGVDLTQEHVDLADCEPLVRGGRVRCFRRWHDP